MPPAPSTSSAAAARAAAARAAPKACKNTHRVYLLRENEALPILLTLPPTSLRAFKDYLAKRLIMKGKRSSDVITCIKLKKEKNADGIAYSACVFSKAADLAPGQIEAIQPACAWIKGVASHVPVVDPERRAGCKRRLCGCAR